MKGKSHLVCGTIAGAAVSVLTHQPIQNILLITGSSALFSLIPDIDHPESMLGHYIKPVSKFIKENLGHRTITHSGLWLCLFAILLYTSFNTMWFPVVLGSTVGFLSHILSDTFTVGGVPWMWPLSRKKIRLTPAKSGAHDWVLVIFTDILIAGAAYLVYNRFPGIW